MWYRISGGAVTPVSQESQTATTAAQDPGSGPCGPPSRRSRAPYPAGVSPGPSSAGRPQVHLSPSAEARPSRARIERSGDVALTARMLWTGVGIVAGAILPDERRPRRQGRGDINRVFVGLGIQSPRQHHPRRPGERRGPQRSGNGVVRVEATAASRLGGRAGRRRRSPQGATRRMYCVRLDVQQPSRTAPLVRIEMTRAINGPERTGCPDAGQAAHLVRVDSKSARTAYGRWPPAAQRTASAPLIATAEARYTPGKQTPPFVHWCPDKSVLLTRTACGTACPLRARTDSEPG